MNKQSLKYIKNGEATVEDTDIYTTAFYEADVRYCIDRSDGTVKLTIDGLWFYREDLKELRKLLKVLEQELS